MLCAPYPFEDAEAFLIAAERAAAEQPDDHIRPDAFSRFVLPAELTVTPCGKPKTEQDRAEEEAKMREFIAEHAEFDAAVATAGGDMTAFSSPDLSEKHKHMLCGPKMSITRMTVLERNEARQALRDRGFSFRAAFPKCATGYSGPALQWISYKRASRGNGVLRICQGEAGQSRTGLGRGHPTPGCELSKLVISISSLQELFCAAEALWPAANNQQTLQAQIEMQAPHLRDALAQDEDEDEDDSPSEEDGPFSDEVGDEQGCGCGSGGDY